VTSIEIPRLKFPEGPRWRDGRWWVSDQLGRRILAVAEDGSHETVAELKRPSGLGFLPDGTLLAATMEPPSVVRVIDGKVSEFVDLRPHASQLNDMCVGPSGHAWLDAYDDPFDAGTHRLLLLDPDGSARTVAKGLRYPNGIALTPDGTTLLVSETFGTAITAFPVGDDHSLGAAITWATLPEGTTPDGLCLDAAGDVWVASYLSGEFLHVKVGGEVLDRVAFPGRWALACSLGGRDGRTLLLCTAKTSQEDYFAGRSEGFLDTLPVEVPGVGCP
jgi:sugar lactone lactonase YvrE